MKIARLYFKDPKPIEYLLKCNDLNERYIQQVLRNNSFLLRKNKQHQCDQIKKLKAQGVRISASGISKFKNGVYKTCSIAYLQIFAMYWKKELPEMMSVDFETEKPNI
jgi:hypothetical protein